MNTLLFHPVGRRGSAAPRGNDVIAVGRFSDPRKNAVLLLESFAQARKSVAALRLVLVDPDGPNAAFQQTVTELELGDDVSVRVRTSNEELADLYRNALCLALSSDEEGFGMVVIEAMASGIPVVATKCGGPDGIITDGHDGFLVPVGDVTALADRLAVLARDAELRREMGRRARHTVEERYSAEKAGQAFLSVYDELLCDRRPMMHTSS